jgi:hypothetical protein
VRAPDIQTVAPDLIPEVETFLVYLRKYEAWKRRHPEAATELLELADKYNPTLAAAAKVVRTRRVACGPFDLYQWRRDDDGDALYAAVGRQKFTASGGVLIRTAETYKIDRERFDARVAAGKVTGAVAKEVVSFAPCFHQPPEIALP